MGAPKKRKKAKEKIFWEVDGTVSIVAKRGGKEVARTALPHKWIFELLNQALKSGLDRLEKEEKLDGVL